MRAKLFIVLLLCINVLCLYGFFIEPFQVVIENRSLPLSMEQSHYSGMTIVHISDLHIQRLGQYEKKVIQKINGLDPDFICISGDIIALNHDFLPAVLFLNQLKAARGIYFTFGNSDHSNMPSFFRAIRQEPLKKTITLLRNTCAQATYNNYPVLVCGIDDPVSGHARPADISMPATRPPFSICLTHAYTHAVRKIALAYDLVLAGHTHGGQVNLFPVAWYAHFEEFKDPVMLSFFSGFKKDNASWVNVSRGIGVSYLPVRVNSKPEISVITLGKKGVTPLF